MNCAWPPSRHGGTTPVVFASHQLGAAVAAAGAGWLRDLEGNYNLAFYLASGLCAVAAILCLNVRKAQFNGPFYVPLRDLDFADS